MYEGWKSMLGACKCHYWHIHYWAYKILLTSHRGTDVDHWRFDHWRLWHEINRVNVWFHKQSIALEITIWQQTGNIRVHFWLPNFVAERTSGEITLVNKMFFTHRQYFVMLKIGVYSEGTTLNRKQLHLKVDCDMTQVIQGRMFYNAYKAMQTSTTWTKAG